VRDHHGADTAGTKNAAVATPGAIAFNVSALTPGRFDKGQVVVRATDHRQCAVD
jgi:hypothetical protein